VRVRLYKYEWGKDDELVYEGDIENLPPGPAADYWAAVKEHHGPDAEDYLRIKAPPLALVFSGWVLEPAD
jgi:hypothetical protein